MPLGIVKSWIYLALAAAVTAGIAIAAWRVGKTLRQKGMGLILLYVALPLWLGALELPAWAKILLLALFAVPAVLCFVPRKNKQKREK